MRIPFKKIKKKYDIIIVGAGITGLTVLDRFLERKIDRRILVVESGSMLSKDPYPSNFSVKSKNLKIKKTSRFFGVGGGSNVWLPSHGLFDKNRINYYFKKFQFPLTYKTYLKYVDKAAKKFKTPHHSTFNQIKNTYKKLFIRKLVVNNHKINFFNFSSLLESKKVDFIENTTVQKLRFNNKSDEIHIRFQGNSSIKKVSGKVIILSTGTLECIRILNKSFKKKQENLGRGFMNHLRGFIGYYKTKKNMFKGSYKKINSHLSSYSGLQLRSKKKTNTYLRIFEGIHSPFLYKLILFFLNKFNSIRDNFFLKFILKFIVKLLTNLNGIIVRLSRYRYSSLMIFTEMKKNYNNLVQLKNNQLIVDYKLSKNDLDGIVDLLNEFEQEFKVKLSPTINFKNIINFINYDTSHHMGGVGMGNGKNFMVNAKSKLRNSNNTFILGGSCLNFSDSVNPTLTYIALSLYFADQICKDYYEKNH
jgi:hypothetical protein